MLMQSVISIYNAWSGYTSSYYDKNKTCSKQVSRLQRKTIMFCRLQKKNLYNKEILKWDEQAQFALKQRAVSNHYKGSLFALFYLW